MRLTTKPLALMTAADLMSRDLVMLPMNMSLRSAAHLLSQARISGAPVIDEKGQCVGVLSAMDFLRWSEVEHAETANPPGCACNPVCDWQVPEEEAIPHESVRDHMTPDPVTIPPETTVGQLARMMIDAHIHRVVVVDEQRRPVGIVTSTDILAAVAQEV